MRREVAEERRPALSDEHVTVGGTQLEARASLKSFQRRDAALGEPPDDQGNPSVDFHGERRRNATHGLGRRGTRPMLQGRLVCLFGSARASVRIGEGDRRQVRALQVRHPHTAR